MSDEALREALRGIADRAAAPSPDYFSDRALRGAIHRRRLTIGGTAAGIVALVAVAAVSSSSFLPPAAEGEKPAPNLVEPANHGLPTPKMPKTVPAMPRNTPEELATVRSCLRADPWVKGGESGKPGYRAQDFRLLASQRYADGMRVLLLGTEKAHTVCRLKPDGKPTSRDLAGRRKVVQEWRTGPDGRLKVIQQQGNGLASNAELLDGWDHNVAGPVPRGVTRITVAYTVHARHPSSPVTETTLTAEAVLRNGFFIAGVPISQETLHGAWMTGVVTFYGTDGDRLASFDTGRPHPF
ncbi:hypothetical protein ABGB12_33345 [Actinocorallia sp. B10E7]|uniref:hypothetical protein n=1 Tax=Actinocorallia sp. B10E7 TaxID=3153558 RepID=UPI00325ED931